MTVRPRKHPIQRKPAPQAPGKRKYTMSAAVMAQRRAAQPAASRAGALVATGPTTEAGKAVTSRNAWVHGRYSAIHRTSFGLGATSLSKLWGKPCLTTCPFHPDNPDRTENPCTLVLNQLTQAGGDCLDKTQYVHTFDALLRAMQEGNMDGMHGVLAAEQAANLQMLNAMRNEISKNGFVMTIPAVDKQGEVVYDKDENMVPAKFIGNPALAPYIALLETLKINLPELMATPKARAQLNDDEQKTDALQTFLGGVMGRFNQGGRGLPPGRGPDA